MDPQPFERLDTYTVAVRGPLDAALAHVPDLVFPGYYFRRWGGGAELSSLQRSSWQLLVSLAAAAQSVFDTSLITRIALRIQDQAAWLGVTPGTLRAHLIRSVRQQAVVASFLPSVGSIASLGPDWLCWTVAFTVPLHPREEEGGRIPPELRTVRWLRNEGTGGRSFGVDFEALAGDRGGWDRFRDEVLQPLLESAGVGNAGALVHGSAGRDFERAFAALGWKAALDVVYRSAQRLDEVERPAAYLRTALIRAAGGHVPLESGTGKGRGSRETVPVTRPNLSLLSSPLSSSSPVPPPSSGPSPSLSSASSAAASVRDPGIGVRELGNPKLVLLRSWLDDLDRDPRERIAREALDFAKSRLAGGGLDDDTREVLEEIQRRAEARLQRADPPVPLPG